MTQDVTLNVSGMKCGGCENNVTEKLNALDGIVSVNAAHKENSVTVAFDEQHTSLDAIKETIADAGYVVED